MVDNANQKSQSPLPGNMVSAAELQLPLTGWVQQEISEAGGYVVASSETALASKTEDINTNYPIPDSYFPALKNDLLLRAARGQSTERTPIWCHRQAGKRLSASETATQCDAHSECVCSLMLTVDFFCCFASIAGRFLPEFRAIRLTTDFFSLCQTPSKACEVTLQPIRRFQLDAAIIFSDILVIPQCLGMIVEMCPGKGPVLPSPITTPEKMTAQLTMNITDAQVRERLHYVFKAITLTRVLLQGTVPLIGFSGAPFTLMCYMTEGGGSKSYDTARSWFYKHPTETHTLLQLLTDTIVAYLIAQVEAGAQMLEVFDSWCGDMGPDTFTEFNLPYLIQIAQRVKQSLREKHMTVVPITIFPKGAHYAVEQLSALSEYDVISLDWCMNRTATRALLDGVTADHRTSGQLMSIQGNLDVSVLHAADDVIRSETRRMLNAFGCQRYIANLGHGMLPSHLPEKLTVFIDEVHRHSEQMIKEQGIDVER